MKTKKDLAIEFIKKIKDMKNEELTKLMENEMGIELVNFCMDYAYRTITKDPNKVVENTIALITLGYLIKANENNTDLMELFKQKPGLA